MKIECCTCGATIESTWEPDIPFDAEVVQRVLMCEACVNMVVNRMIEVDTDHGLEDDSHGTG